MNCVHCENGGSKRKAEYLLFDDNVYRQLLPLCKEHFELYREHFGEDELEYILLDFNGQIGEAELLYLIEEVNRKFRWYEDMMKRLYAEIERLKKIAKLDWISR